MAGYLQNFYQNLSKTKKSDLDYSQDRKVIDDPEMAPL